jgi:hypothetical protein
LIVAIVACSKGSSPAVSELFIITFPSMRRATWIINTHNIKWEQHNTHWELNEKAHKFLYTLLYY